MKVQENFFLRRDMRKKILYRPFVLRRSFNDDRLIQGANEFNEFRVRSLHTSENLLHRIRIVRHSVNPQCTSRLTGRRRYSSKCLRNVRASPGLRWDRLPYFPRSQVRNTIHKLSAQCQGRREVAKHTIVRLLDGRFIAHKVGRRAGSISKTITSMFSNVPNGTYQSPSMATTSSGTQAHGDPRPNASARPR